MSNSKHHHTARVTAKSFQARKNSSRTRFERAADFTTSHFGTMSFLFCNVLWFVAWITVNLGLVPGLTPFDPYPFELLTTTVSLEAIFLAIIVLISQNRASKIADVREEIDLQMDVISEQELTKLIKLVILLLEKHGIDVSDDAELRDMLKTISVETMSESLEKEINKG